MDSSDKIDSHDKLIPHGISNDDLMDDFEMIDDLETINPDCDDEIEMIIQSKINHATGSSAQGMNSESKRPSEGDSKGIVCSSDNDKMIIQKLDEIFSLNLFSDFMADPIELQILKMERLNKNSYKFQSSNTTSTFGINSSSTQNNGTQLTTVSWKDKKSIQKGLVVGSFVGGGMLIGGPIGAFIAAKLALGVTVCTTIVSLIGSGIGVKVGLKVWKSSNKD